MNKSAIAGLTNSAICASGNSLRNPRSAGSHITASPSQLGPRTRIRFGALWFIWFAWFIQLLLFN